MNRDQISTGPIASAIAWLRAELHDGPKDASTVTLKAQRHSIAERALRRACRELQVLKERTGFGRGGRWTWSLPAQEGGSNEIASANENEGKLSLSEPQRPSMVLAQGCDRQQRLQRRRRQYGEQPEPEPEPFQRSSDSRRHPGPDTRGSTGTTRGGAGHSWERCQFLFGRRDHGTNTDWGFTGINLALQPLQVGAHLGALF